MTGLLACLLQGCDLSTNEFEETIERTYQVSPNARISIQNSEGLVFVYGSQSAQLVMQATKRAYSQRRLHEIDIVVSAQPDSVRIETKFPPRDRWSFSDRSGTVDYFVVIPQTAIVERLEMTTGEVLIQSMRGGPVRVQLGNGRLYARNCFCDLDLVMDSGELATNFDWWESRRFSINERIEQGESMCVMPGDASFHVVATTEKGRIANDFTDQEERTERRLSRIDKIIGEHPSAEIKIQMKEGNIQISEQNP